MKEIKMNKFTKKEISLCKQIAEKRRKKIKYGDWYLFCLSDGKTRIQLNYRYTKNGRKKVYNQDVNFFKHCDPKVDAIIPLWTISDCLEFLRERCKDHVLLIHEEGLEDNEEWYLWFDEYKETQQWDKGKTPLEACLKAVLAVLEENLRRIKNEQE